MRRPPSHARAFAIAGGLLFTGALVYFAYAYVVRFDMTGAPADRTNHAAIDLGLFTAFALHHSVFARTGAKAWLQRMVPPPLERSVYVWIASVLFVGVCYFWQPVAGRLWMADGAMRAVLYGVQAAAAVLTLAAARRLDVLDLAGVRQAAHTRGPAATPRLDESGLYRTVRHPIYAAWLLLVWGAPTMNGTRLVFAIVSTAYLVIAIPFEERDLRRTFGAAYDDYRLRVPWRLVPYVY